MARCWSERCGVLIRPPAVTNGPVTHRELLFIAVGLSAGWSSSVPYNHVEKGTRGEPLFFHGGS